MARSVDFARMSATSLSGAQQPIVRDSNGLPPSSLPDSASSIDRRDVRHAGEDEDVADPDAGRAGHPVLDQLGAFRHARHAQPRLGDAAAARIIGLQRSRARVGMDDHRHAERRGDRVDGDVVMGRADAAGGEEIVVRARAARSTASTIALDHVRRPPAPRPGGCPAGSARRRSGRCCGPGCGRTGSRRRSPAAPRSRSVLSAMRSRPLARHAPAARQAAVPAVYIRGHDRISGDHRRRAALAAPARSSSTGPKASRACAAPAAPRPRCSTRSSRMSCPA